VIDLNEVLGKIKPFVQGWIAEHIYAGNARMWNDGVQAGLAFRYLANGTVSAGVIVEFSPTVSGRVRQAAANSDLPAGVALTTASDGGDVWVGQYGRFNVLFKSGVAPLTGYVAFASDVAGRADCAASIPAVAVHNREIGHITATGTTGGLGLVWMQFN
jgi:hypothetical protein